MKINHFKFGNDFLQKIIITFNNNFSGISFRIDKQITEFCIHAIHLKLNLGEIKVCFHKFVIYKIIYINFLPCTRNWTLNFKTQKIVHNNSIRTCTQLVLFWLNDKTRLQYFSLGDWLIVFSSFRFQLFSVPHSRVHRRGIEKIF